MNDELTEVQLSPQAYGEAMNVIAQDLLTALTQAVQKVPAPLRNKEVVAQALSAFLANVIYRNFPQDKQARQHMLDNLTKLVTMHLHDMP